MSPALVDRLRGLSARQRVVVAVVTVLVVGGAIGAAIGASGGGGPKTAALNPTTTTAAPSVTTTTSGLTVPAGNCPLTDVHAANGVPDRPALAIKVGNEPYTSRPQSGLNEADIVFDTPAEGFIMRYVAVYQCTDASMVGPNRSVRWVDWHLVRQFLHPLLAFAGGINPNVDQVESFKWMQADNLLGSAGSASLRTTTRSPPDNLYSNTTKLYALSPAFDKKYGPPPPIFRYSAAPPSTSTPVSSMRINFSYGTDAIWTWNAALGQFMHSYADGTDIDALTGSQVSTTNIVVLIVQYHFGIHIESTGGSGDFESQTLGSGPGYVLRNGRITKITWSRRFVTEPWTFRASDGSLVALAPGRTWVEIVPNTTAAARGALTITP